VIKVRVRVTSAEAIVLDGSFRATWGQMSRGSGGGGGKCLAFAYQMPVCLATTSSSVVTILCERALFGQRVQAAVLHLRRRVI